MTVFIPNIESRYIPETNTYLVIEPLSNASQKIWRFKSAIEAIEKVESIRLKYETLEANKAQIDVMARIDRIINHRLNI
jgi:hypothetical protein